LINDKWQAYRTKNFNKFSHLKLKIKKEILQAKCHWANSKKSDSKHFWNVVNKLTGRIEKNDQCVLDLLKNYSSENDMANDLNKKFSEAFTEVHTTQTAMNQNFESDLTRENKYISIFDVIYELNRLNLKKANPKSNLPIRLYKEAKTILAAPLCSIFNLSLEKNIVPKLWKLSEVIPIPKCKPVKIEQIRPITLLSVPMKILEKFILKFYKHSILQCIDSKQFGFKPKSSTTCALIDITEFVSKQLDNPKVKCVAMVAYDLSKAFDKIDHYLLIKKMVNYKLNTDLCKWISSYLHDREQRVRINSSYSEIVKVSSGVPQGSLLSPLLFSLFVADLQVQEKTSAQLTKYADDMTLLTILKNEDDLSSLKNEMSHVHIWAEKNIMQINAEKSKMLFFTKMNTTSITLPNELFSIKSVSTLKILGITFDKKLEYKEHFKQVLKSASQRLYILRVLKNVMTKLELWNIFNSLIRSLLEYASPLFISLPKSLCSNIERILKRAHKIICGNITNCGCVLITMENRRLDLALRLFDDIYKCTNHPLSHCRLQRSKTTNRLLMPIINRNLRQNTFSIKCALIKNNIFID
jgi:hypothetical protein